MNQWDQLPSEELLVAGDSDKHEQIPLPFIQKRRLRNRWFADSLLEGDGFELPIREHRAMAPSHGFAAASHCEAALGGAPASHGETAFRGAAGFREARRHEVHPARALALDPGSAEARGLLAEVGISYFASAGGTVTVPAAIVLLCGIGLACSASSRLVNGRSAVVW